MTTSASGTATLVVLVCIGPIIYAVPWLYQRLFQSKSAAPEAPLQQHDAQERESLTSSQYLFSLLGYAIGIGNVWRFPYVIAQNGGAAALVAYLICLVLVAAPLYLYEMIIGQYVRQSTITLYKAIHPRWFSLGFASGIMLFLVLSYYALIVAYTLIYIYGSCQDPLPWAEDSAAYWNNNVLSYPADIFSFEGLGSVQGNLAGALALMWAIIGLSTAFGKDILGKITYVTVIMPVALMIILVIRSVFLPGAGDGISFYIGKFEASRLADLSVWSTACSQILFSLSPGFGTAITFSSYAKPKEDVYRVCMTTIVANSAFSIFAGFGIFAIVGNLAHERGETVEEVATASGMGLAFITIAEAMTHFGALANVMSVLFFVMLMTLGLDSAYAWLETLVGYFQDLSETYGFKRRPVWQVTVAMVLVQYGLGLLYCTNMGLVLLDVIDHFVGILFLLVVCFFESLMFVVDVKFHRLALALKKATFGNPGTPNGRSIFPTLLCKVDFFVTVPAITGLLGVYTLVDDFQAPYGGYPSQYVILGWVFFCLLVAMIPLTMLKSGPGTLQPIKELHAEVYALVAEKGDPVNLADIKNNKATFSDEIDENDVEA